MILGLHFLQGLVLLGFLFSFILLSWHYIFHFTKVKPKKHRDPVEQFPVSVIICARNEAENLREHIPTFCLQDYPDFEVLVVNDRSDDNSSQLLEQLQKEFPQLRVLEHRSNEATGKKAALRFGIENAQHEIILLSDADCLPTSNQWIKKMTAAFDEDTDLVLGFGPYEKRKGLLNGFIQYETYLTAIQYFSWAESGLAYMGVGRNLAYRKSAFLSSDLFENSKQLASGDDDLLVQQITSSTNTKSVWLTEASTVSKAPKTFEQWRRQKIRHLSTGTHYTKEIQARLSVFSLSQILFYLLGIVSIVLSLTYSTPQIAFAILGLFAIHWLLLILNHKSKPEALKLRSVLLIPFYDFLFFVYLFSFAPFLFYKPNAHTWNKKWIDSYS